MNPDDLKLAAQVLGRLGGLSKSPKKRRSSAKNGSRTPRVFPRCPACLAAKRTCHHLVPKAVMNAPAND